MEAILRRIVRRTAKVLVGLDEDLGCEADALTALQAAEVERRVRYPDSGLLRPVPPDTLPDLLPDP